MGCCCVAGANQRTIAALWRKGGSGDHGFAANLGDRRGSVLKRLANDRPRAWQTLPAAAAEIQLAANFLQRCRARGNRSPYGFVRHVVADTNDHG